jgi:hypothetical protein
MLFPVFREGAVNTRTFDRGVLPPPPPPPRIFLIERGGESLKMKTSEEEKDNCLGNLMNWSCKHLPDNIVITKITTTDAI